MSSRRKALRRGRKRSQRARALTTPNCAVTGWCCLSAVWMIHLLRAPLRRMAELGDARPIDLSPIEVPQVLDIGAVGPDPDSGVLEKGEGRVDRRSAACPPTEDGSARMARTENRGKLRAGVCARPEERRKDPAQELAEGDPVPIGHARTDIDRPSIDAEGGRYRSGRVRIGRHGTSSPRRAATPPRRR